MKQYLHNQSFKLEVGGTLQGFEIAYHTIGSLSPDADNVVWVCHALTANSNVAEWWEGLIGENALFNPEQHFIVCANVLGGCYGTTGPLSINPQSNEFYYRDFPLITIRDMAKAHDVLRQHLGIEKIKFGLGGSLGGQQIMEWAIDQPTLFENLVLIATNARHSPWGIAFNESQRMAIEADPTWRERSAEAGVNGLRAARAMALLSYRHYDAYGATQKREDDAVDSYKASGYQRHQGKKLSDRFNAFTYYTLSKAMDSHDVGRGRGGIEKALRLIRARTLVIGISNDQLFPIQEQKTLARNIQHAQFRIIDSVFGHDGFLVETKKIAQILFNFFIGEFQREILDEKKLSVSVQSKVLEK